MRWSHVEHHLLADVGVSGLTQCCLGCGHSGNRVGRFNFAHRKSHGMTIDLCTRVEVRAQAQFLGHAQRDGTWTGLELRDGETPSPARETHALPGSSARTRDATRLTTARMPKKIALLFAGQG